MAFQEHPSFPLPDSPNARLWRYMDFVKFFSLTRSRTLYFPSAYQLSEQDPFEGSFTSYHAKYQRVGEVGGDKDRQWIAERDAPPEDWDADKWRWMQAMDAERRRNLRRYFFINSWHMSEHESLAMWKLYDLSGNGIAVVSSFDRLRDSLAANETTLHIGCIQYIDYHTEEKWLGNYFDPFMHKTMELSHEQEVRVIVWEFVDNWMDFVESQMHRRERKLPDPPAGISLPCDLERLIDYIVVSPTAPQWVVHLLEEYCQQMIGKEVRPSNLAAEPFF